MHVGTLQYGPMHSDVLNCIEVKKNSNLGVGVQSWKHDMANLTANNNCYFLISFGLITFCTLHFQLVLANLLTTARGHYARTHCTRQGCSNIGRPAPHTEVWQGNVIAGMSGHGRKIVNPKENKDRNKGRRGALDRKRVTAG